jgi:hypothetical protein
VLNVGVEAQMICAIWLWWEFCQIHSLTCGELEKFCILTDHSAAFLREYLNFHLYTMMDELENFTERLGKLTLSNY